MKVKPLVKGTVRMSWAKRLVMKSQTRKVICEYKKMMTEDSKNVRIRSKLADLYLRNSNLDQAIEEYIEVARDYEEEDLKCRAISIYKKILSLDPRMIEVYHRLANLYRDQGLLGDAKVLYQRMIKLDPGDKVTHRALDEIGGTVSLPVDFRFKYCIFGTRAG